MQTIWASHYKRLEIKQWLMTMMTMMDDNEQWQWKMKMTDDIDWWQWLMTMTDANDWWQWLMIMIDDNNWWLITMTDDDYWLQWLMTIYWWTMTDDLWLMNNETDD